MTLNYSLCVWFVGRQRHISQPNIVNHRSNNTQRPALKQRPKYPYTAPKSNLRSKESPSSSSLPGESTSSYVPKTTLTPTRLLFSHERGSSSSMPRNGEQNTHMNSSSTQPSSSPLTNPCPKPQMETRAELEAAERKRDLQTKISTQLNKIGTHREACVQLSVGWTRCSTPEDRIQVVRSISSYVCWILPSICMYKYTCACTDGGFALSYTYLVASSISYCVMCHPSLLAYTYTLTHEYWRLYPDLSPLPQW